MAAIPLAIDFSFLPDDTALPLSFQMSGFVFESLSLSPLPFINDTAGVRGYQFGKDGVEVTLPATVSAVDLKACSFGQSVLVEALDIAGAIVVTKQIAHNQCADIRILGRDIAALRLTGGSNEGMILRMGIAVTVCE